MSVKHRWYVLGEQGVGAAVVNFGINAFFVWLLFRHLDRVPLWGTESIAGDIIGTSVILPLLTCLIVTRMSRGRLRAGRLTPLGWTRATHPVLGWLPPTTGRRGLVLAAACVATFAPVTLLGLVALAIDGMSFEAFLLFKGLWAAGLAAVVTPVIAIWAIAEPN